MKALALILTLAFAHAQTVDVKDATAGTEETTTIEIKKGKKEDAKTENKVCSSKASYKVKTKMN